jgi:hypothetical protein
MGNRDAVNWHVMPLGDVGCYKQNRNANFIYYAPCRTIPQSSHRSLRRDKWLAWRLLYVLSYRVAAISFAPSSCSSRQTICLYPSSWRPFILVCSPYIIFPPDLSCTVQHFVLSLHSIFVFQRLLCILEPLLSSLQACASLQINFPLILPHLLAQRWYWSWQCLVYPFSWRR